MPRETKCRSASSKFRSQSSTARTVATKVRKHCSRTPPDKQSICRERAKRGQLQPSLGKSTLSRIDESAYAIDGPRFLQSYLAAPIESKFQLLIDTFNEVWLATSWRPESICKLLRDALGSHAPSGAVGLPSVPVPIGFQCQYKSQLALLGLHSSPMTGICCVKQCATAIVLNGGYADDVDRGDVFIYVGEGGELTGHSQSLTGGNKGLLNACQQELPIRVIRGYKALSRYAPTWGFRYDGLYTISEAFWDNGTRDRGVWKFLLCAVPNQHPLGSPSSLAGCLMQQSPVKSKSPTAFPGTPLEPLRKRYLRQEHRQNQKLLNLMSKHEREHQKIQSSTHPESVRFIQVSATDGKSFYIKVNHLLSGRKLRLYEPSRTTAAAELKKKTKFSGTGQKHNWKKTNWSEICDLQAPVDGRVKSTMESQTLLRRSTGWFTGNTMPSGDYLPTPSRRSSTDGILSAGKTLLEQFVGEVNPTQSFGADISQSPACESSPPLRTRSITDCFGHTDPINDLPTFKTLMQILELSTSPIPAQWKLDCCAKFRLSDSNNEKPRWARYGFLPFVIRVTVPAATCSESSVANDWRILGTISVVAGSPRRLGSTIQTTPKLALSARGDVTVDLPINSRLANHHALPYFAQSKLHGIGTSIVLRPPFTESFNPWDDASQGVELYPVRCVNRIDDASPPTDFTYVSSSFSFSNVSYLETVEPVCCGCLPKNLEIAKRLVPVEPSRTSMRRTIKSFLDPETGIAYCGGTVKQNLVTDGFENLKGDCDAACGCSVNFCSNRRWTPFVSFRVHLERFAHLGWGVVTDEDIPSDTFVAGYAGETITFGDMKARVHKYENQGLDNYCFELFKVDEESSDAWKVPCMDSMFFGNVTRFINHSCEPNLRAVVHWHNNNGGRGLSFFSRRAIKAGEQLTYDYGPVYGELKCYCNAPSCRKIIRAAELANEIAAEKERTPVNTWEGSSSSLLQITPSPVGLQRLRCCEPDNK